MSAIFGFSKLEYSKRSGVGVGIMAQRVRFRSQGLTKKNLVEMNEHQSCLDSNNKQPETPYDNFSHRCGCFFPILPKARTGQQADGG